MRRLARNLILFVAGVFLWIAEWLMDRAGDER